MKGKKEAENIHHGSELIRKAFKLMIFDLILVDEDNEESNEWDVANEEIQRTREKKGTKKKKKQKMSEKKEAQEIVKQEEGKKKIK